MSDFHPEPLELTFVRSFFQSDRVERLLALLQTARGRNRAIERLGHCGGFDERLVEWLDPSCQTPADVLSQLRERGAPATCYVVSEEEKIDGSRQRLGDAVAGVVGSSISTLLICDAARLAYYEGEDRNARAILFRAGAAG